MQFSIISQNGVFGYRRLCQKHANTLTKLLSGFSSPGFEHTKKVKGSFCDHKGKIKDVWYTFSFKSKPYVRTKSIPTALDRVYIFGGG